jgi:hypothetical protein
VCFYLTFVSRSHSKYEIDLNSNMFTVCKSSKNGKKTFLFSISAMGRNPVLHRASLAGPLLPYSNFLARGSPIQPKRHDPLSLPALAQVRPSSPSTRLLTRSPNSESIPANPTAPAARSCCLATLVPLHPTPPLL